MLLALISAVVLMLVGFALRAGVKPVRRLHVPSSVIAGLLGLAVVQAIRLLNNDVLPSWLDDIAGQTGQFRQWAGPLIALVFAGILMEKPRKSHDAVPTDVLRQGIASWFVILGQVLIGTVVVWLWAGPAFRLPIAFGQIIEVGMAGGPATAKAMGDVYAKQFDFPQGTDIGLFVATFGLVWGVFSGIALVNVGFRRGWPRLGGKAGPEFVSGIEPELTGESLGEGKVRPDVLDPLMLQLLLIGAAYGVGMLMKSTLGWGLSFFDDPNNAKQLSDHLAGIPLFIFTLLGGLVVREALYAAGLYRLLDPATLQRITGVALEIVIVASLTTISLAALRHYIAPVLVLLALGSAWCVFNLLWVSPRILPRKCWFELGLMNYGFATATTPQSILLLKMVDRDLKTGAAEIYAGAVPLSAPFVGGGILTLVGFPLLSSQVGAWSLVTVCTVTMAALWIAGRRLSRGDIAAQSA
jgi:glutamate:Na+ symporter, ESS family